jgi:hypothetical protein
MSEWKTLGNISVITDTDNGYDCVGEVSGSFGYPPEQLKEHIRKYGHAEVLETLGWMTAQVMACVKDLRQEEEAGKPPVQSNAVGL